MLAGGLSGLLPRPPDATSRTGCYACCWWGGAAGHEFAGRGAAERIGGHVDHPGSLPGGPWAFGLDPLSAWFLLPILGVGACAGVFGVGYLRPERGHRPVAAAHALFALLLVALVGVVTAQAMVPFLAAWEVMAVSGLPADHVRARAGRGATGRLHLSGADPREHAGPGGDVRGAERPRRGSLLRRARRREPGGRTAAHPRADACAGGLRLKAGAVPLHFWLRAPTPPRPRTSRRCCRG